MRAALAAVWRAVASPIEVRGRRFPPIGLVVLTAIGATLVAAVANLAWPRPADEHAYWLAGQRMALGQPLYDPAATLVTPFTYFYPPPLAQVLAPVSQLIPSQIFSIGWIVLLVACLLWLAGGRPLVAFAFIAFLPVAVELEYRNVHLLIAVLIVAALRRAPWLFAVGAAIKVGPGLGIVYLAARGRWRDALVATSVGAAILVVSLTLSTGAWWSFVHDVVGMAPSASAGLIPVAYPVRAAAGVMLAIVAGRLSEAIGEPLLVVAIVLANPTLYTTSLSMLIAIVPIVERRLAVARTTGLGAQSVTATVAAR